MSGRSRAEAAASLNARQKSERDALLKKQKEDRGALFSESWKGKGGLLNRTRSVLAAPQQSKKLNLRDRHSKERGEMKKRFPARFPN